MNKSARLLSIFLLSLSACGGGGSDGGSSDTAAPAIVSAVFLGSGATPASGDRLVLALSEPIELMATALGDADFEFSGTGATLGSLTVSPTVSSTNKLTVTLGAGAAFNPGTTTIAFSAANDAVRDLIGNAAAGSPKTITAGDGDNPAISLITVESIPVALNGQGPAGGILQVPPTGFSIDLSFADATSAIDAATAQITANLAVTANGQQQPPNVNFADALAATPTATGASFELGIDVLLPADTVVILTATVTDATGMTSEPVSLDVRVRELDDDVRPLESTQLWFVDTSRDIESFELKRDPNLGRLELEITTGSNGTPDLEDVMLELGLLSTSPIADIGDGSDSNQSVVSAFEGRVLAELGELFRGVNVDFSFSRPASFPTGRSSVPYNELSFSQICLAGAAAETSGGTLGAALFDFNNAFHNDNCQTDFQGMRLGVFAHTLVNVSFQSSGPTSLYRTTFDPFTPFVGGTAIGDATDDGGRLLGTTRDARTTEINLAVERLARALSVVMAHECGHSMGLVQNGPMPVGLFGNDAVNFPLPSSLRPGSEDGHIFNSDFPSGSQNVMSPAITFEPALSTDTGFNALNMAYLRETALYDN